MLVLARGVGESIIIGHDVKITVLGVSHDRIRIGIDAPSSLGVHREEVYVEIREANVQAAKSAVKVKKPKIITPKAGQRTGQSHELMADGDASTSGRETVCSE